MNYKLFYERLINKAKSKGRTKDSSQYENHHIIPECMGGSDDFSNMVYLTFKEHYLAHYALTKIHSNKELDYAFWAMNNQKGGNSHRNNKINSRLFEAAKKKVSNHMIGNKHNFGNKHSEETKALMSIQATGKHHHGFKGYYITPWGKFESSKVAANEDVSDVSLNKWCKKSKELFLTKNRCYQNQNVFDSNDIGKSLYDLGFDFEPAERVIPKKKVKEKKPEDNSMFRGYYHTPFGKFVSALKMNKERGYRLESWCKKNVKIRRQMVNKFPDVFVENDIGKYTSELGFYFERIDK